MMILRRIIGLPFALVFGLISYIRNFLYDIGIFKSSKFETPIVCVGNLSLGGTGKTPMVEYLISELQENYEIAVLSRGYKRKSRGFILADRASNVNQLGDEPYQIFQKFNSIHLAVDTDRRNGIAILENKFNLDLIILDDAFQHRKVKPNFSILLTAFDKLFCDDYFFPMGTLRDGRSQAKRAHVIVVTKCPLDFSEEQHRRILKKLKPKENQLILFSFLEYAAELKGEKEQMRLEDLKQKKFTLVTGIADPRPLTSYLRNQGFDFKYLRFKDHHSYTTSEIERLNSNELILTTEKDFVRLKGKVKNLFFIEIKHRFFGNGKAELIGRIENLMKQKS